MTTKLVLIISGDGTVRTHETNIEDIKLEEELMDLYDDMSNSNYQVLEPTQENVNNLLNAAKKLFKIMGKK